MIRRAAWWLLLFIAPGLFCDMDFDLGSEEW